MDDARAAGIAAVAALDEPTRRRLYDYVVRQPVAVSRDDAAAALGIPRATAAFHLNRLAGEGLLAVAHERRTGRSGPGAGRPTKLYHRSDQHIEVSLPEHRYALAGRLLAAAIQDAESGGESPKTALDRRAGELGAALAAELGNAEGASDETAAVLRVLEAHGYEPRYDGDTIVLVNCPFHTLARQYTDLVCEMNLCLLGGLLSGLEAGTLRARLEPAENLCCVRLEPRPTTT